MVANVVLPKTKISSLKKISFFGSLYLTQAIPEGYAKFLPIIMTERGSHMKEISILSLIGIGGILKPIFGVLVDSNLLRGKKSKRFTMLGIQLSIMLLFAVSLHFSSSAYNNQVKSLLVFSSILMGIHDTAVDGLLVNGLRESERSAGAFGQYTGYKLGNLFTGGILPVIFEGNHRMMCITMIFAMFAVFSFTALFDFSTIVVDEEVDNPLLNGEKITDRTASNINIDFLSHFLKKVLFSRRGLYMALVLIFYKFAEHGLDFLWSPMLIKSGISRQSVIGTQFFLGTVASLIGAALGSTVVSYSKNSLKALSLCAIARLLPEIVQLLFMKYSWMQSMRVVAVHSILENLIGSSITTCMYSFLLENADKKNPATSFAAMKSLALFGMTAGEFIFGMLSHHVGFSKACLVGLIINTLYPILLLMRRDCSFDRFESNKEE